VQSDRATALYRLFNEPGRLLYVGVAYDPEVRLAQHRRRKPWWPEVDEDRTTLAWHPTREAAEAAELIAIRAEEPVYNIVTSDDQGCARFLSRQSGDRWGRPRWADSASDEAIAKLDAAVALKASREQARRDFESALADLVKPRGVVPISHIAERLGVDRKAIYRHLSRSAS
jgi:predicted GIY-YIG superfamily endonuclease